MGNNAAKIQTWEPVAGSACYGQVESSWGSVGSGVGSSLAHPAPLPLVSFLLAGECSVSRGQAGGRPREGDTRGGWL